MKVVMYSTWPDPDISCVEEPNYWMPFMQCNTQVYSMAFWLGTEADPVEKES